MAKSIKIILEKQNIDQEFPSQDQEEIDRITFFKQSGDLLDFKIIDSNDNLKRVINYIFEDTQETKKVMRDPVLSAIREELQAICYERDIKFTRIKNKNL